MFVLAQGFLFRHVTAGGWDGMIAARRRSGEEPFFKLFHMNYVIFYNDEVMCFKAECKCILHIQDAILYPECTIITRGAYRAALLQEH